MNKLTNEQYFNIFSNAKPCRNTRSEHDLTMCNLILNNPGLPIVTTVKTVSHCEDTQHMGVITRCVIGEYCLGKEQMWINGEFDCDDILRDVLSDYEYDKLDRSEQYELSKRILWTKAIIIYMNVGL